MVAGIIIFIYGLMGFVLVALIYSWASRMIRKGKLITLRVLTVAGFGKEGRMERKLTINRKTIRAISAMVMMALYLGLLSCAMAPTVQSQKEEQRDSERNMIHKMANRTLAQLYEKNPAAQVVVAKATGYAVFISFGGAKGTGVAVDNVTKEETFMRMLNLQPGLAVGAENFLIVRNVFVFKSPAAFTTFVTSGLELGPNAMATGKGQAAVGEFAGGVMVSEGVYMYQVGTEGSIVGGIIKGSKYYQDNELAEAQFLAMTK